jgi:carbon-monoxide dehydrogenase medium subunit
MYDFAYDKMTSLDAAVAAMRDGVDTKPLAGGMSLLSAMKLRLAAPSRLIDLATIPGLDLIEVASTSVTIGAMARHYSVAGSVAIRREIPALAKLAGGIGDVQVRYRGTIGGSLANADPAACYPSAVLALRATIHTDRRSIPADGFFKELFQTALEPDELISAVQFQIPRAAAYVKFTNLASRFAIVGVFVARFDDQVRVAVTGAGPYAFRVHSFEEHLHKAFFPGSLDGIHVPASGLLADGHAPAEYRAHLIGVLARRAVEICNDKKSES